MKYRYLVASDMDYTLFVTGQEVSGENRKAIKELREAGVAFTLATGRTSFLVSKYVRDLDIDVPCITSNGGAFYDPSSMTEILPNNMKEETVREIFRILLDRGIDCAGYSGEGIYFAPDSKRRKFFEDYNKTVPKKEQVSFFLLDEALLDRDTLPPFSKILVVGADEKTTRELRSRKDIESVASTGDFFDLMNIGSSKGNGLLRLADMLGIPRENTFAIGDNENDLSMLEMASHSIAMGNSRKEILDACDYITSDCKDDGFAKAVREYILPIVRRS